jgi:hypothetical protein
MFTTVAQAVYAISSGFLIYDELDRSLASNVKALNSFGISILLLPSESLSESADIVVARLLQRRPWLNPQKEREKFEYRYRRYRSYGDIRIYCKESPEKVAAHMKTRYFEYLRTKDALDSVDMNATIVSHDEDDID